MSDKGIYAIGVVIALALFVAINNGSWLQPEKEVFPIPGTECVGSTGKPIPMDEPILPVMSEPETTAVETTEAETTSGRTYLGNYKLTAYCSCSICRNKWGKRTAVNPTQGRTIAVDPTVIPYGTSVYIEGYGTYIAEDTGGVIKNSRIDMFFNSHTEALKFGVRYADVYLED